MNANRKRFCTALVVLPLLAAIGCASGDIDDPGSPPNLLQVDLTDTPAVTGTLDQATGGCLFQITEWEATFNNEPKNILAVESPYNDYFVEQFRVTYSWPGVAVTVPPPRALPSPGTVKPGEQKNIPFEPILLQDFDTQNMPGTTGILNMVVDARYADGTRVSIPLTEALVIESCR